MDNNILEMLTKLMASNNGFSGNNSNFNSSNPANAYYPSEVCQNQYASNSQQNPFSGLNNMFNNSQSNLMPMLLSMMGNKNLSSIAEIFSAKNNAEKTDSNKKAEVSSAPNDEILL